MNREAPKETADVATTDDVFLGGALTVLQPASGYRAGIDAVLLAAAVPLEARAGAQVLDAGAGVGVAGLCLARRVAGARVTLLEIEPRLAALARENARRNGLDARCRIVVGDIAGPAADLTACGVVPESYDLAMANPPFGIEGQGRPPADALRARAHEMPAGALEDWMRGIVRALRPGGRMIMIHRADALPGLLAAMSPRFGGIVVRPIHPYAESPAIRVLVSGQKGSRAPLVLAPALVLHGPDGGYRPQVEAVLRSPVALPPAVAPAR
jgi:tRNA1(Val) A37 N6-methylase TrmN6